MRGNIVIGGASGFWGEAAHATRQLLGAQRLDYLVYDYLAEVTLSIMARARAKDPAAGFAPDFINAALAPNIGEIARRGVRVVANAGGVNPRACAAAVRELVAAKGLALKVAVVEGDDLLPRAAEFADSGVREMFSGEQFPDPATIQSVNAYLGAFPIAQALGEGADIVVTGRCADSALALACCIHAFGWEQDDHALLAAGSLAGHLVECGPQATGGNFTDWREAGDIAKIGYPLAEISSNGGIVISKPDGTAGIVSRLSVGEQLLYEIGDPAAYLLPDVTCDFTGVTMTDAGPHRVEVRGARGLPPPPALKVSATFADGFRAGQLLSFNGFEARAKAQAYCDGAIARARAVLRAMNAPDYDEASVELSGGPAGAAPGYEEITAKVAVRHRDARAVGLFLRELVGLALATPPGLSMFTGGGRPKPSPVVRLFSFLLDRSKVAPTFDLGGGPRPAQDRASPAAPSAFPAVVPPAEPSGEWLVEVPLIRLAVARSGDKGDKANIGVIARRPEQLPWIWRALTPQAVKAHFAGLVEGEVERFHLPGLGAMNIVMDRALGGGGVASLRNDAQGKGFAQMLLAIPVAVPQALIEGEE